MSKVGTYLFNLSPRTVATMFIVSPVLAFLVHLICAILIRLSFRSTGAYEELINTNQSILYLFLGTIMLLWAVWLNSVVNAVDELKLGVARQWFRWAFALFIAYLLFSLWYSFYDAFPEYVQSVLRALNESIAAAGLLIAYPTLCHFAARAIYVQRNTANAGFLNTIPFTLILVFGTVLSIPFFHRHFSTKSTTKSEIIKVYAKALAICIIVFVVGFIAAIAGLI